MEDKKGGQALKNIENTGKTMKKVLDITLEESL